MLHDKISPCSQREGRDGRVVAQKPLIVRVERDGVAARGVVVDQAEVIRRVRGSFSDATEEIQTLGDGPRGAGLVFIPPNGSGWAGGFDQFHLLGPIGTSSGDDEATRLVDSKHRRVPGRVDLHLLPKPLDRIPHTVEKQPRAQELEKFPLDAFRDEGLEI